MQENNGDNEDNKEIFNEGDFVYTIEPGENGENRIMAGGYRIDSYFLQGGISPIMTMNTTYDERQTYDENQDGGNNVSKPFEHLAVPAGLFYVNMPNNTEKREMEYNKHTPIDDDIYDKLFSLIQEQPKKMRNKKTRRYIDKNIDKNIKHKRTRKHV